MTDWVTNRRLVRPSDVRRMFVGLEDGIAGVLDVVVLSGIDGPEQRGYRGSHENDAQGDEQKHDAHATPRRVRASRAALRTTNRELVDIPIAATQGGIQPIAAKGTAARL